MKKMMKALGCAAMIALAECDGEKRSAESIGIIGGNDGPAATWMTTRLAPSPGLILRAKGDLIGRIGILQIEPVDFEHRV